MLVIGRGLEGDGLKIRVREASEITITCLIKKTVQCNSVHQLLVISAPDQLDTSSSYRPDSEADTGRR